MLNMPNGPIYGESGVWYVMTVPVVTDVDARTKLSMLGSSYVLTNGTVTSGALLASMDIHPDCLVFTQEAPTLTLETQTGAVTFGSSLKLTDGYNTTVTDTGDGVLITGIEGGGLGRLPTDRMKEGMCGLRSINGIEGAVSLSGYNQTTIAGGTITLEFMAFAPGGAT